MQYPKDVAIWEYAPGRKLAQVIIRVKNVKGAMARCSEAVSDMGVNMLTGFANAPTNQPVATWSFFADITEAKVNLRAFRQNLQDLPLVESVEVQASEDGFMVDKQHFPVQWAGRRAIILRAEALSEMLSRLWDVFGSGAATIIDQMAEAMGRHSAKEIIQDFGEEFATEQLEELLSTYTALGYAEVKAERSRSSEFPLVLHARELFECEANAKRKVHRRSVFFKAHVRGFMSGIFDTDFDVTEVQCMTEGDEVCSFRVAISESSVAALSSRSSDKNTRALSQSNF